MPVEPSAQHRVEADSLGAVGHQAAGLAKLCRGQRQMRARGSPAAPEDAVPRRLL